MDGSFHKHLNQLRVLTNKHMGKYCQSVLSEGENDICFLASDTDSTLTVDNVQFLNLEGSNKNPIVKKSKNEHDCSFKCSTDPQCTFSQFFGPKGKPPKKLKIETTVNEFAEGLEDQIRQEKIEKEKKKKEKELPLSTKGEGHKCEEECEFSTEKVVKWNDWKGEWAGWKDGEENSKYDGEHYREHHERRSRQCRTQGGKTMYCSKPAAFDEETGEYTEYSTTDKPCLGKCRRRGENYYHCNVGSHNGFITSVCTNLGCTSWSTNVYDIDYCSPKDPDLEPPPSCPEFQEPDKQKLYQPLTENDKKTKYLGNKITIHCQDGHVREDIPTKSNITTVCSGAGEWSRQSFKFPYCIKPINVACKVPSKSYLHQIKLETVETKPHISVNKTVKVACKQPLKGPVITLKCLNTGLFDKDIATSAQCYEKEEISGYCRVDQDLKVQENIGTAILGPNKTYKFNCPENEVLKHSNQATAEVICQNKNIHVIENNVKTDLTISDLTCVKKPNCSENCQCQPPASELLIERKIKLVNDKEIISLGDIVSYRCKGDNTYWDEASEELKADFKQTCRKNGLEPKLPKCQLFCPDGFIKGPNGQCYYISEIELSQPDAALHCNEVGGNLLEIASGQDKLGAVVLMEVEAEKRQNAIKEANQTVVDIKTDSSGLLKVLKEKREKRKKRIRENQESTCKEKYADNNDYLIEPISLVSFCNDVADTLVRNLDREINELSEISSSSVYLSDFEEKIKTFIKLDMDEIDSDHKDFINNAKLAKGKENNENIKEIIAEVLEFFRKIKREKLGNFFKTSFFTDESFMHYLNRVLKGDTKEGRHNVEKAILNISTALTDDKTDFVTLLNGVENTYCENTVCPKENDKIICKKRENKKIICDQINIMLLQNDNVVTKHFMDIVQNGNDTHPDDTNALEYVKKLIVKRITFGIKTDIGTQEDSKLQRAEEKLRKLNLKIPKLDYGEEQFDPDFTKNSIIGDLLDDKSKNFQFTDSVIFHL